MSAHTQDPSARDAAVEAALAVMGGHIERESNRVYEWPADEADLHRNGNWTSFLERRAAVSRLRAEKIVDAVLNAHSPASPGTGIAVHLNEPEAVEVLAGVLVQLDHTDDYVRAFGATLDELEPWERDAARGAARELLAALTHPSSERNSA